MPAQVRNPTTAKKKAPRKPTAVATPAREVTTATAGWPMARTRPIVPLVGLGLGLVTFVIYWLTLSPTVNFVDSGELIAVGVTAGVAHAPGYPLYTLMLILVAALPFGGVAMRINAISAVTA